MLQNCFFFSLWVSLFTEQLLHMKPHINAMGFFTVGKHLFPTVNIGEYTFFFEMFVKSCDFFTNAAANRDNADVLPYSRAISFS